MSLKLTSFEQVVVTKILKQHVKNAEVWAFGSRVHGRHLKPFSDLDLVIKADELLPSAARFKLQEAFSESDLPFRVDIVEWAGVSDEFKAIIAESSVRVI